MSSTNVVRTSPVTCDAAIARHHHAHADARAPRARPAAPPRRRRARRSWRTARTSDATIRIDSRAGGSPGTIGRCRVEWRHRSAPGPAATDGARRAAAPPHRRRPRRALPSPAAWASPACASDVVCGVATALRHRRRLRASASVFAAPAAGTGAPCAGFWPPAWRPSSASAPAAGCGRRHGFRRLHPAPRQRSRPRPQPQPGSRPCGGDAARPRPARPARRRGGVSTASRALGGGASAGSGVGFLRRAIVGSASSLRTGGRTLGSVAAGRDNPGHFRARIAAVQPPHRPPPPP